MRQARKGLGRTSPNPSVGAVIVMEGKIVAQGYHRKAGMPHAEVEALNRLGGYARGGTLYVTLEPCNHQGRTPPCTEAILRSGLKRVVVGMNDPNPGVRGGGCQFLRKHGIEVRIGVLEDQCRGLNEAFLKFVTSKRPLVILKSALTLDGWSATSTGHSKWITSEKSRQAVHRLRDRVDAVLVGIGTVLKDDPELTTRLKRGGGKHPLRVIVDTHLRIPLDARVLSQDSSGKTVIATGPHVKPEKRIQVERTGASVLVCPVKEGRIDLKALLVRLGEMEVTSLLVEGGATVAGSMIRERLIDKFMIFQAPKLLGGDDGVPMAAGTGARKMDECLLLKDMQVRRFGQDILLIGYPNDGGDR